MEYFIILHGCHMPAQRDPMIKHFKVEIRPRTQLVEPLFLTAYERDTENIKLIISNVSDKNHNRKERITYAKMDALKLKT